MPVPRIGGRDPGAHAQSRHTQCSGDKSRRCDLGECHRAHPYDLFSPDPLATLPVLSAPIILACNGFGEIAGVEHLGQTGAHLAVFVDRAPHSAECAADCPARCNDSDRSSAQRKDWCGR